jgi:hypothetical protein
MRNAFLRTALVFFFGMSAASAFGEAAPRSPRATEKYPSHSSPIAASRREVRFVAQGREYRVFLTEEETVIALRRGDRTHLVQMRFENANAPAPLAGENKLGSISNYFIGAPSRQHHRRSQLRGRAPPRAL